MMLAEIGLPPGAEVERQSLVGVAFILDTKLQAARTALRNGRSVNSTAGPHRSLRARARSCTMCSPVAPFHLAPQRFIRTSNRLLQVASALPLPSGKPSRRARA